MWIQILAHECEAANWRRAWLLYCVADFSGKTWAFPARVVEIDKVPVVAEFDDLEPYWQNRHPAALRWGIGYADDPINVKRRIDATQKDLEGLAVGTEVIVTIDVRDISVMENFQAAKGVFETTAHVLRAPSGAGPTSKGAEGGGGSGPPPAHPKSSTAPTVPPVAAPGVAPHPRRLRANLPLVAFGRRLTHGSN